MRWQDLPESKNIQDDTTYGPSLALAAPWSMGPKQSPLQIPSIEQRMMRLAQIYSPHTPEQNQFLQSYMPAQLPLNPIAGSLPSGLTFMGNTPIAQSQPGQRWPGGPSTSMPGPPIPQYQNQPGHQFIPGPLANWNNGGQ